MIFKVKLLVNDDTFTVSAVLEVIFILLIDITGGIL